MLRTISPFLVTGVVLAGAATVVANPLVAAPSDIRVSVSDMAPGGQPLDILDPVFLESIGAMRPGWPTAVATLDALLADLAENPTSVSPQVLAEALQRAAEAPPATEDSPGVQDHEAAMRLATPETLTDPTESAVVVMRTLANLSSGINEAAGTLVQQVTMTPALILALTEQVISGELTPVEALRRLINAPFGGQAVITGDERIDAAFQNTILQPILDALNSNANTPVRTGTDERKSGVTGGTSTDTSISAAQDRSSLDRGSSSSPSTAARQTATAAAPQRPTVQQDRGPADSAPSTSAPAPGTPGSPAFESDTTGGIRQQIRDVFEQLGDTVKRLTGQDDNEQRVERPPAVQQPTRGTDTDTDTGAGTDDSGSNDDDANDAPTSGVGR
ncbi:hypothetical protein A5757_19400 [Mycobacterium sp. 852013-51886_SCH5428379]|uniref:hypothetical protein n=1 Tax=Mycobacterium sp. 852013-51886_SCH5428379 TaxID=1834111 RepID=UPI0007FE4B25|nr:hypothetical protein [Mycobacterium sp. 852013-51886_SCH5428379]OBB57981.1 hypothetical protein A5757_19400 [Mycobacterium sp. 852013-51886_SCH5428379]